MTWTYDESPGTDTAAERRDAVRVLVGDTDTSDQLASDEAIAFHLGQAKDDVYSAAALTARGIAANFSRRADVSLESVKVSYQQRSKAFMTLAAQLEKDGVKFGKTGLGKPRAGGISISEMESNREDSDRPRPAFARGRFRNPTRNDTSRFNRGEDY